MKDKEQTSFHNSTMPGYISTEPRHMHRRNTKKLYRQSKNTLETSKTQDETSNKNTGVPLVLCICVFCSIRTIHVNMHNDGERDSQKYRYGLKL